MTQTQSKTRQGCPHTFGLMYIIWPKEGTLNNAAQSISAAPDFSVTYRMMHVVT